MATLRGKAWILLIEAKSLRHLRLIEMESVGTADEAWAIARRGFTLDTLDGVKAVRAFRVADMAKVEI